MGFLGLLIASYWFLSRFGNDTATAFGTPLLWIGLVLVLTRILTTRAGLRRAGKRSARSATAWGWVVTILGSAMALFLTWQLISPTIVPRDGGWQAWLVSVAMTLALSQYWFNIARRTKEAPEILAPTTASVLYLRAFDEERRTFAFGPTSVLKQYTSRWTAHAPLQRGDPTLRLTLEDYLDETISAQLGPFVALGNPYDKLSPDGATREYAADSEWQKRFLDLSERATCIVVSIGGSANLEWELKQIMSRGWGQKLCLFTSPIVPGTDRKLLNRLRRTAVKRAKSIAADWNQARDVLRSTGLALADNPGPGAAVTFDEQGNSTLLTTSATTPAEFVAPVADWFKEGRKSGRCIAVSCRLCGSQTHVTPSAAPEEAQCYACWQKQELAQMSFTDRHPIVLGVWGIIALAIAVAVSVLALQTNSLWIVLPIWAVVAFLPLALPAIWKSGLNAKRQKQGQGGET
jgi:hypothetical protein